jgi:hypothetical protein
MTRALLFAAVLALGACDGAPLASRGAQADGSINQQLAGDVAPDAGAVDLGREAQLEAPMATGCGSGYHVAVYPIATGRYCAPDDVGAGPPMLNPCEPGAWPVGWLGQGIVKCSAVDGGGP